MEGNPASRFEKALLEESSASSKITDNSFIPPVYYVFNWLLLGLIASEEDKSEGLMKDEARL